MYLQDCSCYEKRIGYRYPWISHKIPSTWRSMRIRRCRNRSERGFHGLRGGHPEGRWLRSAFHWNCRITWPKAATSPSNSEDASKRPNMGSVVLRWMDALLVRPVTYHCHTSIRCFYMYLPFTIFGRETIWGLSKIPFPGQPSIAQPIA